MRKIVVTEFISMDGVFEDPGGSEDFKYGGWSMKFNSDENMKYKFDELMRADALLLGRVTYQGFAQAWPKMEESTGEFGKKMNEMPKYVVSDTLSKLYWQNSQFIKGALVDEIKRLKKMPGKDILVAGSGQLVRFLLDNNLVDKLCLMVYPIVLGSGESLLTGAELKSFELSNLKKFPGGTVVLEYTPVKKSR